MSEQLSREDRAIERAWQRCLERGDVIDPGAALDPADEALTREYTELLGLLPYELDAATPNLSTKIRLLAVVGGEAAASGSMAARSESRPFSPDKVPNPVALSAAEREVDDLTIRTPTVPLDHDLSMDAERSAVDVTLRHAPPEFGAGVDAGPGGSLLAMPAVVVAPRSSSWGTWAMAAMLGFCVLGLGYLGLQAQEQAAIIAQLEAERAQVPPVEPEFANLTQDYETLQRRFRMVTEVAQSAYPMRTVSSTSAANRPGGMIYVCGQHQRWYLNAKGLEAPAAGKEYHLWFMTDQGTVSGGVIEVDASGIVQMEALAMPTGTQGFSITLEDAGEHAEPEGLMILLGEQAVSL